MIEPLEAKRHAPWQLPGIVRRVLDDAGIEWGDDRKPPVVAVNDALDGMGDDD